ncbi:MAG: hypothetical protein ACOY93_16990 [Bacillota bacterium]
MLMEISIRQGKYAPGRLISPRTEVLYWTPVRKDAAGNQTGELVCRNVTELRFTKPAASANFHVVVRGQPGPDGIGEEWTIVLPSERTGLLFVPVGFAAEQSIMGAVYRLPQPRDIRLLADLYAGMPGINLTVQLLS